MNEPSSGKNILHIEGTDAADNTTATIANGSTLHVTDNGVSNDYSIAAIDEIHYRGHAGNDVAAIDGAIACLYGGSGDNTLTGGSLENFITAAGGNNIITGGSGQNITEVGDGNNNITAGDAGDIIIAGDGSNAITGGSGGDYIAVGDGSNTITGGSGGNAMIAGNANNIIQAGDGGDSITVGDGDNTIAAGAGDDNIVAGSGTNQINGRGANDEVNGLVSDPVIQMYAGPSVREGSGMNITVWINQPTDHDVTATLDIRAPEGELASSRWDNPQLAVVIPAGQTFVQVPINALDDGVPDDPEDFGVGLEDVSGAEYSGDSNGTVSVYDSSLGISVNWGGGSEVPTSFSGTVPATIGPDGSINSDCDGNSYCIDNYGHSFQIQILIDQTTGVQTFDMTIDGIPAEWPAGVGHWTGSSDGDTPFSIVADVNFGSGGWSIVGPPTVQSTCNAPGSSTPQYASVTSQFKGATYDQEINQSGEVWHGIGIPDVNGIVVTGQTGGGVEKDTTTGQLFAYGYYGTVNGQQIFPGGANMYLTNFQNSGSIAYGRTSELRQTLWMKTGNFLTEDTVMHLTDEGGKYCTQVQVYAVGLRRLEPELKPTYGLGVGDGTLNPDGVSVSIPLIYPFSMKVGIKEIQNASAVEGPYLVGGTPEIIMGAAVAGDGQTLMHRAKSYKTLMLDDVPWTQIVGPQGSGSSYPYGDFMRQVKKRTMIDSAQ